MSNIEWTTKTLNPLAGCSKISDGCKNCYAIKDAHRLAGNPNKKVSGKYAGTTKNENGKLNWTGNINFLEDALLKALFVKKPTTYFVNSMSDLFHDEVKQEWIDKIFALAALTPQHTYQILTKRAERMRDYFSAGKDVLSKRWSEVSYDFGLTRISSDDDDDDAIPCDVFNHTQENFPLPNVWLGISIENQKAADERIPLLLEIPAKIRFLSCEPLLENVDLPLYYCCNCFEFTKTEKVNSDKDWGCTVCGCYKTGGVKPSLENGIDWVIVGGESGNGARPCSIDWIRNIVQQSKAAHVPVFVKQLGANVWLSREEWHTMPAEDKYLLRDAQQMRIDHEFAEVNEGHTKIFTKNKKGGEISEFPADLQVREMPEII